MGGARLGDLEPDASGNASITFNADGTTSFFGNESSSPGLWFSPQTPGIGSSYWLKATLGFGPAWSSGPADGAVVSLSAGRLIQWTLNRNGDIYANTTISIYADAGGTILVRSGTLTTFITVGFL